MAITEKGVADLRKTVERAYSRVIDVRVSPIPLLALLDGYAELRQVLADLLWAIAGEQEDPAELARALGPEAPVAIARARTILARAREGGNERP